MDFTNITVGQAMTRQVYFVTPDSYLTEVDELFAVHDFHHLPVIENGILTGMISKSDMLLLSCAFPLDDPSARRKRNHELYSKLLAGEIMSRHVVKLREDMTLAVAAGIFMENLFHAIPVVAADGKLAGILTTLDLLRVAYMHQPSLP